MNKNKIFIGIISTSCLVIIAIGILLSGGSYNASADLTTIINNDSIKVYDKVLQEVTIRDSEVKNIVKYKLTNYGNSVVNGWAEGEYVLYKETSLFTGVFYKDIIGTIGDLENVKFFIWEDKSETRYNSIYEDQNCIIDYSNSTNKTGIEICDSVLISNKSYEVDLSGWINYKEGTDLKISSGRWKLEAEKIANKPIDFVLEAQGQELTEWAWWNSSWGYKRVINITETSGSSLSNYSTLLYINYTEDTDSHANVDFSDLRFTNSMEDTELEYWIENKTNSSFAWAWVKIPSLTASSVTSIYMYYGNSEVETASDIKTTFLLGDDFNDASIDTSIWDAQGNPTESSGYLEVNDDGDGIFADNFINQAMIIEGRILYNGGTGYLVCTGGANGYSSSGTWKMFNNPRINLCFDYGSKISWIETSSDETPTGDRMATTKDAYHIIKIVLDGSTFYGYQDGSLIDSITDGYSNYLKINFGNSDYTSTGNARADWIIARAYASSIPTYIIGAEETDIAYCTFSGYVKDESGTALVGANVTIWNQNNVSKYYSNTTIADGKWSVQIPNSTNTYMAGAYYNNTLIGQLKQGISGTC